MAADNRRSTSPLMDLPKEILGMASGAFLVAEPVTCQLLFQIMLEITAQALMPRCFYKGPACGYCKHPKMPYTVLGPLRLVSRAFNVYYTPMLFHKVVLNGFQRNHVLQMPVPSPIFEHVQHLEIWMRDFPKEDIQRFYDHIIKTKEEERKMDAFFDTVEEFLAPLLTKMQHLRTLCLKMDYVCLHHPWGDSARRHDALNPVCRSMVARCVAAASLKNLEYLSLCLLQSHDGGHKSEEFVLATREEVKKTEGWPQNVAFELLDAHYDSTAECQCPVWKDCYTRQLIVARV